MAAAFAEPTWLRRWTRKFARTSMDGHVLLTKEQLDRFAGQDRTVGLVLGAIKKTLLKATNRTNRQSCWDSIHLS